MDGSNQGLSGAAGVSPIVPPATVFTEESYQQLPGLKQKRYPPSSLVPVAQWQMYSLCAVNGDLISSVKFRAWWQTGLYIKKGSVEGTNLNTDGVVILQPLHCAINIYLVMISNKNLYSVNVLY